MPIAFKFNHDICVSMRGLTFGVDDNDDDDVSIASEQQLMCSISHCIVTLLSPLKRLVIINAIRPLPILSLYDNFCKQKILFITEAILSDEALEAETMIYYWVTV